MTTRIKKYAKLREQINREIKLLELKQKDSEKIKKFRNLINKIDKNIFSESQLEAEKIFPNFSSFVKTEDERDKKKLIETLDEMKKWNKKIDEIKNLNKYSTIENYIPELENENFIYNNLNLIKQKEKEISNNFQNIKNEKQNINERANKINEYEIENIDLEKTISENISNIEQQKGIIKKISQTQKNKTKWIWILNVTFLLIQIICLILLLILK